MILIDPSLASADPLTLKEQIAAVADLPALHLDVEDGNFIPNVTFGMKTIRAAAAVAPQTLDAHLMVTEPAMWIDDLLDAGVKRIAFHIESSPYPAEHLHRIRSGGGKAGLAFNLMAPVELALPYRDDLDYLLIMTSEPDGRGQQFRQAMVEKVAGARRLFGPDIPIVVDGGITAERIPQLAEAGATVFVLGRAVWSAADPSAECRRLAALGGKSV